MVLIDSFVLLFNGGLAVHFSLDILILYSIVAAKFHWKKLVMEQFMFNGKFELLLVDCASAQALLFTQVHWQHLA